MTELGEVTVIAETPRALLCRFHDLHEQPTLWVPVSALLPDTEAKRKGDFGVLCVEAWLARTVRQKHPPAVLFR